MFNKKWWFLNFQKELLNFSFCIRKLAVAFYMINEILPKIKFQNIVQCPFNNVHTCRSLLLFNLHKILWLIHRLLRGTMSRLIFILYFLAFLSLWMGLQTNISITSTIDRWTRSRYLRGHNWVHFAHRLLVYCYLEFKLRYLINLKLFLIRVKELFEPIVLRKKATSFCSF